MMHNPMWRRVAVALVLALSAIQARAEQDKPAELKVSVALGPAYAMGAAAGRWAAKIAEKSDGRLTARVFHGAWLAQRDPAREFTALRDGIADLAVATTLYWAVDVPPLGVVGLPWLASEPARLDALVTGPMADALMAAIERAGVVPLALSPLGHREFASRSKAVRAPADLAGLKVRVTTAPVLTTLYGAFGAQPMTMDFAMSQSAFAAGTLDLQDGTPASFAGSHLAAVGVKHVVLWHAVAEVAVFAVNRARWTAWSDADRALVRETAQQTARELGSLARQENDGALTGLQKSGISVVRLTAAERAAFASAARGAYDKLAAEAGTELARMAEETVKTAGK